jgi:hypothetical protein
MKTGDKDFYTIDQQTSDIFLRTLFPGPVLYDVAQGQLSRMSIIAAPGCGNTISSCSKVSTTGVTYELTFYMTNNIAKQSKLYI